MFSEEKTIDDIQTAFVAKKGNPTTVAGKAFFELEQKIPLKGNRFYGIFDENNNEYHACVALNESNKAIAQKFSQGSIKGGRYAVTTLEGNYNDIVRKIGIAFEFLSGKYKRDFSRPGVEFYKRHTEIVVMLPIK